jgi:tetratricopeptide (TPR) repeat protein
MRGWIALTVLSAGFLASQPAFAAKPTALEKQAKKACLSGDYVKGVSILAELFVDTGDATYLYNQGRCYEQNVRYVEAAERFREYLRKAPKLTTDDMAEVEKHIADCEVAIAKSHSAEATPPAPAPQPVPVPVPQPAPQPLVPQGTTTVQAAPASASRPWQHTAKWVATGAAVAFLGLGIAEHVNYYGKNQDYNNDPKCIAGGCQSLANSADTAQTVAIVGYGAAAVATGLAITFWLTDKPAPQAGEHAGIGLSCAPALAGVSCAGRF